MLQDAALRDYVFGDDESVETALGSTAAAPATAAATAPATAPATAAAPATAKTASSQSILSGGGSSTEGFAVVGTYPNESEMCGGGGVDGAHTNLAAIKGGIQGFDGHFGSSVAPLVR